MANPKTPTTIARLADNTPVGFDAPATDAAVAEAEAEAEAEDADEVGEAEVLEPEAVLAAEAAAVEAADDSLASTLDSVGLKVLKKFFTSEGRDEYHPGVEPAANSLAKTLADVGLDKSLMTEAGTAVSRTERIEAGGRIAVNFSTALSKLDNAAGFVGKVVIPISAALQRLSVTHFCTEKSRAYSEINSAVSHDCRFSISGAANPNVTKAMTEHVLNHILRGQEVMVRDSVPKNISRV
ncbi:hypothetical protein UCRPC4_g01322 [Phaeomoniella chlamydospora]|uniref:Uncharacterized protein n=1 Tax=Phaeomoniella chlamydospora TaxID=158046 RepID=A0A0G2EWL0_PHACM|nr:hypothetical protein UCRPC4_g01322 [Phaeomoniella chlamydospora]